MSRNSIFLKAPAKINLFLDVTGREPSGFHTLSTLFQAVTLFDEIIIKKSRKNSVRTDHKELMGKANIVDAVLAHYRNELGIEQCFMVRVKKKIPVGAGLGGGSSDAAAALFGISELLGLNLSFQELCRIGQSMGKDVPFFFKAGLQRGSHFGEQLESLPLSQDFFLLIIYPGFEISTKESYGRLDPASFNQGASSFEQLLHSMKQKKPDLSSWPLYNIFEKDAFQQYPVLAGIKADLLGSGAENSLMSGTGSAVFGLFQEEKEAQAAKIKLKDKYKNIILCSTFSGGLFLD